MYAVVGNDGVVYGPVPVATLYEWIAQGRLVPTSEVIDWQGRRMPATMAPELQAAFFPAYPRPDAFAPMPFRPAKSKGTALALAFFLGMFGAHRFYLGHRASGLAMLALNLGTLCFITNLEMAILLGVVTTVWLIADMAMIGSGALREKGS